MAKQVAKQEIGGVKTGARKFESKVFKNWWTRGGHRFEAEDYSFRIAHNGRRETVSLLTPDMREAARRAARFHYVLKVNGWDAAFADLSPEVARVQARRDVPTVGEFIEAASKVATEVKPETFRQYCVALRWLTALVRDIKRDRTRYDYKTGGHEVWLAKVDAVSLADLTPKATERAIAEFIMQRGASDSSRRTGASMLRQARGLFSAKMQRLLPFENLPSPFEGVKITAPRSPRYVPTFDSAALVNSARTELRDSDPEAWKALLLLLGAGLRKGEADRLTWSNFDAARGVVKILTGKTADSIGEVPLGSETTAELERLRAEATGLFVLKGEARVSERRRSYRAIDTFERLQEWLSKHGVTARMKLHSLRKEAGSLVNAIAGIHAASSFLRHASIGITAAHYVDARNKVTVGVFEPQTNGRKES